MNNNVFTPKELETYFNKWYNLYVIKMTYNVALKRRIIMKDLVEKVGLNREEYWGFRRITSNQLKTIIELGGINGRLIINKTGVC